MLGLATSRAALPILLLLIPSTISFLPQAPRISCCPQRIHHGPAVASSWGAAAAMGRSAAPQTAMQQQLASGRNMAMAAGGSLTLTKGPDAAIVLVGGGAERAKVAQALSSLTSRPVVSVGEASKLAGVLQGESACVVEYSGAGEALSSLSPSDALVVNLMQYTEECGVSRPGAFDVAVGSGPSVDGSVVSVTAEEAAKEVLRLYRFCLQPPRSKEQVELMMGANTFFLSLTYPEVAAFLPILQGLEEGVDALELRVDLLARRDEWSVLQQVALLKRHSVQPVIFTVRSKGQVGAFPDDPVALFALLRQGLRAGVEVVDVEANWERHHRNDLITRAGPYRGRTLLLGSYHVVGRPTTDEQARELFRECYHEGDVDGVKVVLTAMDPRDSYRVHEVAASLGLPVPIIALCLGEKGKLSRVLNSRYTPVTSTLLPSAAAPGQLTSSTIMRLRQELGIIPAKRFFLLGTPISASPSPDMHNAAFRKCQLPHQYGLFETDDVNTFNDTIRSPDFGGASVTIPHKETIGALLDHILPAAQVIGAVNTIIPETDPVTGKVTLLGDNTDWVGILRPVKDRLTRCKGGDVSSGAALVVGGGGTSLAAAYAMTQLGLKVVVYNRTPSKAEVVASRFNGKAVGDLTDTKALMEATGGRPITVIVSTIPAAAGFTVPAEMLSSKPVVMDAAYKPAETALLAQARAAGCPFIQGADMLIGQGMEQFERWAKRQAPSDVMRAAVYTRVDQLQ